MTVVIADAVDLCLVVTRRRHVEDTGLGETGRRCTARWMRITQCIAGPLLDGSARRLSLV
jgi:hypothetical protein